MQILKLYMETIQSKILLQMLMKLLFSHPLKILRMSFLQSHFLSFSHSPMILLMTISLRLHKNLDLQLKENAKVLSYLGCQNCRKKRKRNWTKKGKPISNQFSCKMSTTKQQSNNWSWFSKTVQKLSGLRYWRIHTQTSQKDAVTYLSRQKRGWRGLYTWVV